MQLNLFALVLLFSGCLLLCTHLLLLSACMHMCTCMPRHVYKQVFTFDPVFLVYKGVHSLVQVICCFFPVLLYFSCSFVCCHEVVLARDSACAFVIMSPRAAGARARTWAWCAMADNYVGFLQTGHSCSVMCVFSCKCTPTSLPVRYAV